ncbi:uncharacterized protein LOC130728876 [Lotus japonicus]|uniref:uncharacterized protein LOC130728876 n=1 Tax=Lotus japonicus TaxID=34305 RepID=UPI00258D11CE|nr:uncharacterized protein LOC130728876 [Lotus japonicus]
MKNKILLIHVRCGLMLDARKLFDDIPEKGANLEGAMWKWISQMQLDSYRSIRYGEHNDIRIIEDSCCLKAIIFYNINNSPLIVGYDYQWDFKEAVSDPKKVVECLRNIMAKGSCSSSFILMHPYLEYCLGILPFCVE